MSLKLCVRLAKELFGDLTLTLTLGVAMLATWSKGTYQNTWKKCSYLTMKQKKIIEWWNGFKYTCILMK